MLLIENCFHWVGFHITRHLLEKGYHVDGVGHVDTEKKEHLSMFIGRHSAFRCYQTTEMLSEQQYDVSIRVHDHTLRLAGSRSVTIHLPFIFGEWMPVTDHASNNRLKDLPFHSDKYWPGGMYVGDLVNGVEQWIQASQLPAVMKVQSAEDPHLEGVQLENYVYVRNNRSALENAEKVKCHYRRYQLFY